jgi:DUF1680 family protein
VNGTWYFVDKQIPDGSVPVFIGIGSGFDILRWLVWTEAGYGRKISMHNVDLGDVVEAVALKLGVEDDENLEVRIAEIPKSVARVEKLEEITGNWKDIGYVPTRTIYGPKLARSTRIDPK